MKCFIIEKDDLEMHISLIIDAVSLLKISRLQNNVRSNINALYSLFMFMYSVHFPHELLTHPETKNE